MFKGQLQRVVKQILVKKTLFSLQKIIAVYMT